MLLPALHSAAAAAGNIAQRGQETEPAVIRFAARWIWVGFLAGCGMWGGWYFGQACYWLGSWLRIRGML